jgi:hypothetical protein
MNLFFVFANENPILQLCKIETNMLMAMCRASQST